MERRCARFESMKRFLSESGDSGISVTACRSLILKAFSAVRISPLSTYAVPGPTFPPLTRINGEPAGNSPLISRMFSPGTDFPFRCPDMLPNTTTFLVATSLKSSAPACLSSMEKPLVSTSNLMTAITAPCATTSSARSSPGILLRNIAFPESPASVPNASLSRDSISSLPSPMAGRISPGLFIWNVLASEPQPQALPRTRVPHLSHQRASVLPLAT